MNVYQFLDHVKQYPEKYIHYCEIIIGKIGEIELAHPCHVEKLIDIARRKAKISREEYLDTIPTLCSPTHWIVSKENYICVWYNRILASKEINRYQKKVIETLQEHHILDPDLIYEYTDEYERYVKNVEKIVDIEQNIERLRYIDFESMFGIPEIEDIELERILEKEKETIEDLGVTKLQSFRTGDNS